MTSNDLVPSIKLIRSYLEPFEENGLDSTLSASVDEPEVEANLFPSTDIPNEILNFINRKAATEEAMTSFNNDITRGQVRRISNIQNEAKQSLHAPLSMLLIKKEGSSWFGYAVSPHVNYASSKDVLLESYYDGDFDPSAGIIHTSIPLTISQKNLGSLKAVLSEDRVNTIEEVSSNAVEYTSQNFMPGRFIEAKTATGKNVALGYPLQSSELLAEYFEVFQKLSHFAQSTEVENTESMLSRFWNQAEKWQSAFSGMLTIKPAVEYAMSDSSSENILDISGLFVSAKESDGLIELKCTNTRIEPLIVELVQNQVISQSIRLSTQQSDSIYIDNSSPYHIAIKTDLDSLLIELRTEE